MPTFPCFEVEGEVASVEKKWPRRFDDANRIQLYGGEQLREFLMLCQIRIIILQGGGGLVS